MGQQNVIDPKIDGGKWHELKRREIEAQITRPALPLEPKSGWGDFPSVDIPKDYNFGPMYHFIVETRPKLTTLRKSHSDATGNGSDGTSESVSESEEDVAVGSDPFDDDKPLILNKKHLRKGYRLVKSRFVLNPKDGSTDSHYFIKATVRPSMRQRVTYQTTAVISISSGTVLKGTCRCPSQSLGRCVHVSAVLLFVCRHIKLHGYAAITCTSKPCYWRQGAKDKDPGPVKAKDYPSKFKFKERSCSDPRTTFAKIRLANRRKMMDDLLCHLSANPAPLFLNTLWKISYEDFSLTIEDEVSLQLNCEQFAKSLRTVSEFSGSIVEWTNTLNQSEDESWFAARSVRITASEAKTAAGLTSTSAKRNFLRRSLWRLDDAISTKAMAYGKEHEDDARRSYLNVIRKEHPSACVRQMGFMTNASYPQLGCSPDGIIVTPGRSNRLLEIKCPYILRDDDVLAFDRVLLPNQLSTFCLKKDETGRAFLDPSHQYYYQVQLSMGLLELDFCDFVVWSRKSVLIIEVPFDKLFFSNFALSLKSKHRSLMAPEYFLMRVPRELDPLELRYD